MVYPIISSGIGAKVCVDGHVLVDRDGNTGGAGYLVPDPHGFMACDCGHNGHWEGYCLGNNILKYVCEFHGGDPVDTAFPIFDPGFSAVDVFEHVGDNEFVDRTISRPDYWNAMSVANIVHVYALLIIYVGGVVALNSPDLVPEPTRE